MRRRLLNPGPVSLTAGVRAALTRSDLCHRESAFTVLQEDVTRRLASVYPEAAAGYTPVLLTGSGTAAVEAMVGSLVSDDGKALVVANGVYGERIAAILDRQQKSYTLIRSDWTAKIDVAKALRVLAADPRITHAITVHHETTTGRLNELSALGAACLERGVGMLVDAVSSFGGEPIEFDRWNVEACAATANKCLHGVPGIAFVLVKRNVLAGRKTGARGIYLDLFHHAAAQGKGGTSFTPAVQTLYALQQALQELDAFGGWRERHRQYVRLSTQLRDGLTQLGYPLLLAPQAYSSMLSSFVLPSWAGFDLLAERLDRRGFVIYPGQAMLENTIFRIAVMGDLGHDDIAEVVESFAEVRDELGVGVKERARAPSAGTDR